MPRKPSDIRDFMKGTSKGQMTEKKQLKEVEKKKKQAERKMVSAAKQQAAIVKSSESHEKKMAREHAVMSHMERELARAKRETEREEKKAAREAAKVARQNAKEERMEALKAKRDEMAAKKEAAKKEREAKKAEVIAARAAKIEATNARRAARFEKQKAKEAKVSPRILKMIHETPEWEAGISYNDGNIVKHKGVLFIAVPGHRVTSLHPSEHQIHGWMPYEMFKKQEKAKVAKAKRDEKAAAKAAARAAEKEAKKQAREAKKAPAVKEVASTAVIAHPSEDIYGFSNPIAPEKRAELTMADYIDKLEKETKKLSKKMLPIDAEREARKKIDAKFYVPFV